MLEAKITEGKDGNRQLKNFYTPLAEAKIEIWQRWNDKELRKKVEDFLKGNVPDIFKKEPKAVFARHVATPNFENIHFLKKTQVSAIEPIILEFTKDKFSTNNRCKYFLGKAVFHSGRNGGKSTLEKLINFDDSENKCLAKIHTKWGEDLVGFHHRIYKKIFPDINTKISDQSDWIKKEGERPDKFYPCFLTLFIRNGILFENYLLNNEEIEFTKNIVLPSLEKIKSYFGVSPLIVRLLPMKNEAADYWYYYPEFLKESIKSAKK